MDQFALSELYKVKNNKRRAGAANESFWIAALEMIERCVLLQQAVFPVSDIHNQETLVFRDAQELRLFSEMQGDIDFVNSSEVETRQIFDFANGYLRDGTVPLVDFSVDAVLEGNRNAWLPDLHITVNADFSQFADGTRTRRSETGDAIVRIAQRWAAQKLTFDEYLEAEIADFWSSAHSSLRTRRVADN